ncbi:MAG: DUF362 domain-containing protein [Bacteroidales bacterium]|jgi:uncharacterized protein (DUF362 family)|nr:DUF362 domain-containing protein [Bacteroidales bacterium]NLH23601.1 DUF362 domain-containing protein [Bacteroidales bacterium]
MERRNFLRTAFLGTVAGIAGMKNNKLLALNSRPEADAPQSEITPDLVAVMGGEPDQLYARAIQEMGGMKRYIKSGMKVVVKPNIGWDKAPEFAACTNPILVAAIVRDCLDAGASEVKVFDHTCDQWKGCYENSGIQEAVRQAGGQMVYAHEEKYFRETELPSAIRMKRPKIHEALLDCDAWINVPVLKNHGGARMTICMKNYMGIVWDRRYLHSNDLQQCIADAATFSKKPVLNIVDAYRIITQNGPKGRGLEDVQTPKALFVSSDIVAVDTAATQFFNQFSPMTIQEASHILLAEKHNLGTTKLDKLNIKRILL